MTSERSKRRDLLALVFISKSISEKVLIKKNLLIFKKIYICKCRENGIDRLRNGQLRRRRRRISAHVLRKDHQQTPRFALTWAPEDKRSTARPRESWREPGDGFFHLEWSCCLYEMQSSLGKISQWPFSPRGEDRANLMKVISLEKPRCFWRENNKNI